MDRNYKTIQKELKKHKDAIIYLVQEIDNYKLMVNEEWYDTAEMKRRFNFSDSKLEKLRKNNTIPFTTMFGHPLYPKSIINKMLLDEVYQKGHQRDRDFDDKETQ